MIKLKQDETTITLEYSKQEFSFIKNEPTESVRLLEHLVYALGLNTDSCKLDIKIISE